MKRLLSLSLSLLLFSSFSVSAFAHSGRTDESGGHYDYSVGEYHYHHGYAAHQHTDLDGDGDLDCPYDFDDKTSHNPSYSSAASTSHSSNTASHVVVYTPQPKITPNKETSVKEAYDEPSVAPYILFFIFGWTSVILFFSLRSQKNKNKENTMRYEKRLNEAREDKRESLDRLKLEYDNAIKKEHLKTKEILERAYVGKTLSQICGAPYGCDIGLDGLPRGSGSEEWGEGYTFYISSTGTYHKRKCRYATQAAINACYLRGNKKYKPCAFCKPVLPNMDWYDEYWRIERLMREYGIEKQE